MSRKLKVDANELWGKCGLWLTNHDLFGRSAEEAALAIVKGKKLTDDELAFLLIVATETLTKGKI